MWGAVLGAVVCAGLVTGVVTPSWAGAGAAGGGVESPVVGEFALGDAAQGLVDERSGAFSVSVPLGGLGLTWDSRSVGTKHVGFGFGPGWALAGVGFVDTEGGVRVVPARSTQGAFAADASVPSGLAGYVGDDVRFTQAPGVLPARADGLVGERAYAFVLAELGGTVSYFDAAGDPLTKLDAHGNRVDWKWAGGRRLVEVVTETGVVTGLDWSDPGRVEVTVGAGAGAGAPAGSGAIELDAGRIAAVTDATGARTSFGYTGSGLLYRVGSASGASTEVTWQALADGTAAVDRVVVVDPVTGEQVTERRWEAVAGLASGWPAYSSAVEAGVRAGVEARTAVTDGSTRVLSTYDNGRMMTGRQTSVSTPSGERVVQSQAFTFPDRDSGATGRVDRPTGMALTHHDRSGGTRTVSEAYVFDEFGRVAERTAADGTVTVTEYDEVVPDPGEGPEGRGVPIGLPMLERTEAPDGLVSETRYTLNDARTAVTIAETFAGSTAGQGAAELTRTGRSEFVVEEDGFVSTERVFPQGGAGDPLVTEHAKTIELAAGTVTTTDTVAAGTELAATTSTVADLVHGQPTTRTDVMGNSATAVYDPAGRPVEVTDSAGRTTFTEYRTRQADGVNATVTTRQDRFAMIEERDVIGRATRTLDNVLDGAVVDGHSRVAETRGYLSPNTVEVTDAWGWSTVTEHDAFGRVVHASVGSGLAQVTEYDEVAGTRSAGFTMTGSLADAEFVTTEHFDAKGQVTEQSGTRADGIPVAQAVSEFDGFGRQTRSSDGVSDARVEYDVHGNPVTTTVDPVSADGAGADGAGAAGAGADSAGAAAGGDASGDPLVATRRFDERGTSIEKTLGAAGETRTGGEWEHDRLGRQKTVTDQAGGVTSYEYTPDGLVAKETTAAGAVTTNTYDSGSRQLTESSTTSPSGDAVSTGYEYDGVTGRLLAVFDPADADATTIRYAYDAWGNTIGIAYPDGRTIEHGYDPHGRKIRTTDVTGATTEFRHEPSGLLIGAVQHEPDRTDVVAASVTYAYDDFGRVTGLERGNGVRTEVTYTSASEIASETTTGPDGIVQSERAYAYDPNGNLTSRIDSVGGPGTEPETTTTAYGYDLHHRLTSSTIHDGNSTAGVVQTRTEYSLNVSGDVTREQVTTDPGSPDERTTSRDLAYSPTGQLHELSTTSADGITETLTQDYDVAGNLTRAADGTRYVYNARNQPVHETTPAGAAIGTGYWADGARATLIAAGEHTRFYWDDGALLNDAHTVADATRTASYLLGVTREARTLTGGSTGHGAVYTVHDRHGNTTELTDTAGATTTRYEYSDYGTTTTHAGAPGQPDTDEASRYPFLYSGAYTNRTGTQHLAVRTYAPDRFGFTSLDTLPLQNRYGYANANPITNIDPSGHFAVQDLIHGLSVGAGVLFAVVLGVSIYGTGGLAAMSIPAILAATGFFLVDAAAAAIGTIGLVHTYGPKFLQPEDEERLEYTEYGLLAAGAIGMFFRAPQVTAKLTGASNKRQAAKLAAEEMILRNANNEVANFSRGRQLVLDEVNKTAIVQDLRKLSTSEILPHLDSAQENLNTVRTAYLKTAKGWKGGNPTEQELKQFVELHHLEMSNVDSSLNHAMWSMGRDLPHATDTQWMAFARAFDGSPYLKTPQIKNILAEILNRPV